MNNKINWLIGTTWNDVTVKDAYIVPDEFGVPTLFLTGGCTIHSIDITVTISEDGEVEFE